MSGRAVRVAGAPNVGPVHTPVPPGKEIYWEAIRARGAGRPQARTCDATDGRPWAELTRGRWG
jgi:hypothetical protein